MFHFLNFYTYFSPRKIDRARFYTAIFAVLVLFITLFLTLFVFSADAITCPANSTPSLDETDCYNADGYSVLQKGVSTDNTNGGATNPSGTADSSTAATKAYQACMAEGKDGTTCEKVYDDALFSSGANTTNNGGVGTANNTSGASTAKNTQLPPRNTGNIIPCDGSQQRPCDFKALVTLGNNIIDFLIYKFATPLAVLLFMWAGFLFMFNSASEGNVTKAKGMFVNVLIGFVVALAAFLIVKMVLTGLIVGESYYTGVLK